MVLSVENAHNCAFAIVRRIPSVIVILLRSARSFREICVGGSLLFLGVNVKPSRKDPFHRQNTSLTIGLIGVITYVGGVHGGAVICIVTRWSL